MALNSPAQQTNENVPCKRADAIAFAPNRVRHINAEMLTTGFVHRASSAQLLNSDYLRRAACCQAGRYDEALVVVALGVGELLFEITYGQ